MDKTDKQNESDKTLDVENRLRKIEDKLERIEDKLDIAINILQKDLVKNTEKMRDHIDFIDGVYDKVRTPVNYMMKKLGFKKTIERKKLIFSQSNLHTLDKD